MVSLADSTDDCTGIRTGNDASEGSKKVRTTPTMPTAKQRQVRVYIGIQNSKLIAKTGD